jgi:hypothetical protein
MFQDSVISALMVMTYWQTHVAALAYLFLFLAPTIIVCFIIKKRQGACIKYLKMLLLPVLEAIAVAVFVLTLFPIILGLGEDALWGFPLRILKLSPGGFLGLLGILMVLSIALTFITRLAKLESFKTLVLGCISLIFVQIFLSFINPIIEVEIMDLIPGFWFVLGVTAISGALSKLGHYVSVFFATGLGDKFGFKDGVAELLMLPLTPILGFIPVFVYGAWLA